MASGMEAARLFTSVGADLTGLRVGAKQAEGMSRGIASKMAAAAAAGAAAFGAMRIGAAVGKEVIGVDTGLRKTNSLFGLTGRTGERSFRQLGVGVKALSNEMGIAQSTLSEGLYQAISAGVPRSNVFDFMRIATKASIAGVTDSATAVDGLSTAMNAFKSQSLSAKTAADQMFMAVNIGKTEFPDLAHNIGKAAPMIAAAKVKFSDFMAAIATLTSKGINTEESMTDLKAAMQSVLKPTKDMTKAYKTLGVDGWDELLKKKGSMQGAFKAIASAAGGNQEKLIQMMGTMEGVNAVLSLTGVNSKDAAAALTGIKGSAGAADKAYGELNKSVGRSWETLKVRLTNFGVQIANQFLPQVIASLSQFASKAQAAFNDPAVQAGIVQFAGNVRSLATTLASGVGFVMAHKAAFESLAVGMLAARAATVVLGAAQAVYAAYSASLIAGITGVRDAFLALQIAMVSNPIGALAVGVGLLAGAFMALKSRTSETESAMNAAATATTALGNAIDSLTGGNLTAKEAQLQLVTATGLVAAAQTAVAATNTKAGRASGEHQQAVHNLAVAQAGLARAQDTARKATADNNTHLTAAKAAYEDATAKLSPMAARYAHLAERVRDHNAMTRESHTTIVKMKEEMSQLKSKMDPLSAVIDATATEMRNLGKAAAGSEQQVADLNRTLAQSKSKTITLTMKVTGGNLSGNPMLAPRAPKPPRSSVVTGGADGDPTTALARGGRVTKETYFAGEDGPEQIVPLSGKYRAEGLKNWHAAGNALGIPGFRKGGLHGKAKTRPVPKAHNVGTSAGDIAAAKRRADQHEAALTAKKNAAAGRLQDAITAQQAAVNALPGATTKARGSKAAADAVQKKYDGAKKKGNLGKALRDAKAKAKRDADAVTKLQKAIKTNADKRESLSDEVASLEAQAATAKESEANQPSTDAMERFDKLRSKYEEQRASADIELANAEATPGEADDALAKGRIRDIAGASAGEYRTFLRDHPALNQEGRTSILHEIATAIRAQTEPLSSGNGDTSALAGAYKQRETDRANVAEGNLRLSERGFAALNGPNDIGYGGGRNAYQAAGGAQPHTVYNINALSGFDPAVQRAMAAASNGGNATGSNADRLYSGRSAVL